MTNPELKACPWCGKPLYIRTSVNPYGVCRTEGCFGTRMPVVPLDVPRMVEQYNTRTPDLEASIARLVEALRPFANVAKYAPSTVGKADVVIAVYHEEGRWTIHLDLDDFRHAHQALVDQEGK